MKDKKEEIISAIKCFAEILCTYCTIAELFRRDIPNILINEVYIPRTKLWRDAGISEGRAFVPWVIKDSTFVDSNQLLAMDINFEVEQLFTQRLSELLENNHFSKTDLCCITIEGARYGIKILYDHMSKIKKESAVFLPRDPKGTYDKVSKLTALQFSLLQNFTNPLKQISSLKFDIWLHLLKHIQTFDNDKKRLEMLYLIRKAKENTFFKIPKPVFGIILDKANLNMKEYKFSDEIATESKFFKSNVSK